MRRTRGARRRSRRSVSETGLRHAAAKSCEHVFVSIKGSSYARFRRALEVGRLPVVLDAASELPQLSLEDALDVLALIAAQDRALYPRAAARWLRRLAAERSPTLAQQRLALAAADLLPADPRCIDTLRRIAGG